MAPTGEGHGVRPAPLKTSATPTPLAVTTGNGINYNGGPVMQGTPNVYVIWYGNWSGTGSNTALTQSAIQHFLGSIGGSALELVNTTYGDTTGDVSGNVAFGGSTSVFSSTNLSDAGVLTQVSNAIINGRLPKDANGVYFVISSSNINETSGFCTRYCGWHSHATIGNSDIKYSFVGNPDRCPSGCESSMIGPHSKGIDGIANVLSHELEEMISDPDLNAWFDSAGNENADKCNFNFGPTVSCNSGKANQFFGADCWLLQQNWRNSGGGACAQHL